MAGAKEKEKKSGKDAGKETGKEEGSGALLRRLVEEMSALRGEVEALKSTVPPPGSVTESAPVAAPLRTKKRGEATGAETALATELKTYLKAPTDAAIVVGHAYRARNGEGQNTGSEEVFITGGLEGILAVEDTEVARLGAAFASAPKIALLRALLLEGAQSAAQLGERAVLTTGSLYHHLRELTHAEVIASAGRNRFVLTERGRQTALLLFAQAGRPPA